MPLTGVQHDTLSQSEREAVAGTVALARHARSPQATGPGAGSPALLAGRRDRCGLALPRVRAGWHGSCSVVRIETCARHPGWNSLRRQDDGISTRGCAWGKREAVEEGEDDENTVAVRRAWSRGGADVSAGLGEGRRAGGEGTG